MKLMPAGLIAIMHIVAPRRGAWVETGQERKIR